MAGNEEYGVDEDPHMSDLLPDDPCPSLLRRAVSPSLLHMVL